MTDHIATSGQWRVTPPNDRPSDLHRLAGPPRPPAPPVQWAVARGPLAVPVGESVALDGPPVQGAAVRPPWFRRWAADLERCCFGALVSMVVHLAVLIVLAMLYPMAAPDGAGVALTAGYVPDLGEFDAMVHEPLHFEVESHPLSEHVDAPVHFEAVEVRMASIAPSRADRPLPHPGFELRGLLGDDPLATAGSHAAPGRRNGREQSALGTGRPPLRTSTSAADAVSGLGGDIARRLSDGDTLVVWMLDASTSMQADRAEAGQQMVRVFWELDALTSDRPYHHRHALMYFGLGSRQLVPPTRKWRDVTRAVPHIPNDPSGVENVFTALEYAIPEYRRRWDKQLLFVIWTDESGDDVHKLEGTIALCREHGVSVLAVGPSAVLGRPKGLQFFQLNQHWSWWLPVDKGPDAGVPQLAQLPHWFGGPLPNVMPSGFGPYSLVRLSQATGGSFTMYDRERERSPFRIEDLKEYLPDYRDRETIRREMAGHPLRRAVVEAAEITARAPYLDPPQFSFDWPFYHSPIEFRQKLSAGVRRDLHYVNSTIPLIDTALRRLSEPYLDVELTREPLARWRANYLLTKGRLLAMSVRSREYTHLATEILAERVIRANSNEGEFAPSGVLQMGDAAREQERQARELLRRCAEEHPGTPWAALAEWEMRFPFGLRFGQRYVPSSGVATGVPTAPTPPRL